MLRVTPELQPDPTADDRLATQVMAALRDTGYGLHDAIRVSVTRGWVTLSGQIEWDFQKRTALYAVKSLADVAGVRDEIVLRYAPPALRETLLAC